LRRRFFVSQFSDNAAKLEGAAAHHLARVLRVEPGQLYELSDGQRLFLARVEAVGRDLVEFSLIEPLETRPVRVAATLLVAVVKFDRFEWALEKATELGAATIVPLAAARSEKTLVAAAAKRAERWEKILFESAQQARCLRAPKLGSIRSPKEAFAGEKSPVQILLSERAEDPSLRTVLGAAPGKLRMPEAGVVHAAIAVGPEGGWTEEEFRAAESSGFAAARLGSNILRAETAAIAGLSAVHLYFD
jgi:16S rRNA (uracil1498-N3)-methyltransferase